MNIPGLLLKQESNFLSPKVMSAFIYITTAKILYIIIPHQLIKNKPQCKEVSVKKKQATGTLSYAYALW